MLVEIDQAGLTADGKYKLVPIEPTDAMLNAMGSASPLGDGRYDNWRERNRMYELPRYRALLASVPPAPDEN